MNEIDKQNKYLEIEIKIDKLKIKQAKLWHEITKINGQIRDLKIYQRKYE